MDIIVITDSLDKEKEDYVSDCAWAVGIDEGIVVCPISYSTQEWESSLIHQSHFAKSARRDGVYLRGEKNFTIDYNTITAWAGKIKGVKQ
jgi:hypothetical protein